MKKLLTTTALLISSFTASADWVSTEIGAKGDAIFFAALYSDRVGVPSVALFSDNKDCDEFSDKAYPISPIKINGTWIKQNIQCAGSQMAIIYPSTVEGLNYVVKEFKESRVVSYEHKDGYVLRFSANGFTKAYNKKLWESEIEEVAL